MERKTLERRTVLKGASLPSAWLGAAYRPRRLPASNRLPPPWQHSNVCANANRFSFHTFSIHTSPKRKMLHFGLVL